MLPEDDLTTIAEALRDLPAVVEASGADVARALKAVVTDTANAGTSAEGGAWQLTQDGRVPLRGAAAAVLESSGPRVARLVVKNHHALHDLGRANGGIVRSILPVKADGKIAKAVTVAVERRVKLHIGRVGL